PYDVPNPAPSLPAAAPACPPPTPAPAIPIQHLASLSSDCVSTEPEASESLSTAVPIRVLASSIPYLITTAFPLASVVSFGRASVSPVSKLIASTSPSSVASKE